MRTASSSRNAQLLLYYPLHRSFGRYVKPIPFDPEITEVICPTVSRLPRQKIHRHIGDASYTLNAALHAAPHTLLGSHTRVDLRLNASACTPK